MFDNLYVSLLNVPGAQGLNQLAAQHGLQVFVSSHFLDTCRGDKVVRISTRHFIYLPDVLNCFDYYFDAVESVPAEGKNVVDYSTPRYHKLIGFDLFPVYLPSFSEPFVTCSQYLDFACLQEGDVVLDLGAYSGVTSMTFAEKVGRSGKVIAVEADPQNQAALDKNLAQYNRMNLPPVEVVKAAVWKDCNGVTFSSEGNMGSSAVPIVGDQRGVLVKSPSVTLDEIARRFSLSKVSFIKCDVEGAELHVFETNFLKEFRPKIVVEPHPVHNISCDGVAGMVSGRLRSFGYRTEIIEQLGLKIPLICATA